MASTKTEPKRLPRLTRMQVQKYYQVRIMSAELAKLHKTLKDLDDRRRVIAGELEEIFGDRTTMRMDGRTILVRDQVKCEAKTIQRAAYSYTKWKEKRG